MSKVIGWQLDVKGHSQVGSKCDLNLPAFGDFMTVRRSFVSYGFTLRIQPRIRHASFPLPSSPGPTPFLPVFLDS